MEVLGWSPHLTRERAEAAGVRFIATKEELFRESDIVSIHLVLSDSTRHLVTAADLALLKPTAIFVNTSRGPIVDEQALVQVLQERKIAAAGLDVYDVEPLPLDHPLRELDNVTLSPHLGYVSDDNYKVCTRTGRGETEHALTPPIVTRRSGHRRWKISRPFSRGRRHESSPERRDNGRDTNWRGSSSSPFCSLYGMLFVLEHARTV